MNDTMKKYKETLIQRAIDKYQHIVPLPLKSQECFTTHDNLLIYWFNTPDGSTHILTEAVS